ncbi:MAG: hypothetical protein WCQ77_13280 [Planctomycetota bacterium]
MSVYNVYCLGTGHSSDQAERLLPIICRMYDRSPADRKVLMEGLGTSAFVQSVRAANDGAAATGLGLRSKAFGKGWGNVVMQVMAGLQAAHQAQTITLVNLVGHSRGAVTCHMIAHAIAHALPRVECNIFAIDPVPGGAFDFSPWWELSAAERAQLGLDGKSPEFLPDNVLAHFSILMEEDTNPGFGVLGPGKLRGGGKKTAFGYLPMYGRHGCCVKSDIDNVPASRIALSILLEHLRGWGVLVDDMGRLTQPQYAEAYAEIYLKAIAEGNNPKNVANYSKMKVAAVVLGTVLSGGLLGLMHGSSYWRNRRASDIPNDFRQNPYYLNTHHKDVFNADQASRNVAKGLDEDGFMSRTEFDRFSKLFPKSYELLVRTGLARSLEDSATMTAEDRMIFSLGGATNIKRLEIRPSNTHTRALATLLMALVVTALKEPTNKGIVMDDLRIFTPAAWKLATHVRFGSRGDQVAVIDQLLPVYHQFLSSKNAGAASRIASWIGEQAEQHLRTKPRSDRRKGMVQLAMQVRATLQS